MQNSMRRSTYDFSAHLKCRVRVTQGCTNGKIMLTRHLGLNQPLWHSALCSSCCAGLCCSGFYFHSNMHCTFSIGFLKPRNIANWLNFKFRSLAGQCVHRPCGSQLIIFEQVPFENFISSLQRRLGETYSSGFIP